MVDRNPLPARRRGETFKLKFPGQRGTFHVTCGYYGDDSLGELFINSPKVATPMEAIVKASAVLVSIGLQHGAPIGVLADALPKNEDGSQSTVIGAALEEIMKQGLDRCPTHMALPPLKKIKVTDKYRDEVAAIIRDVARDLTNNAKT
jgi:hypothetical protein